MFARAILIALLVVTVLGVPAPGQQGSPVHQAQRARLVMQLFHPAEVLGIDEYQRLLSVGHRFRSSSNQDTSPTRTVLEARNLLRLGQTEEAREHLERAQRAGAQSSDISCMLALLLAEDEQPGLRRRALEVINQALRKQPDDWDLHLARATIYVALTFEAYAVRELDRLIEREPGSAEAHAIKGQLIVEGLTRHGRRQSGVFVGEIPGSRAEAERLLATAITLDQHSERALRWLAHLYLYEGDWVRSMPVLNRMVREGIEPALAHLGQGMAFYHLGWYADARRCFEAAELELGPQTGHLVRNPGWGMPIEDLRPPEPGRYDSTAVEIFWASRDPLLSDEQEMRSLEQMRRFAMVAWFFGLPRLGLEGWETLKGQIYLRYGTPEVWTSASSAKLHPWRLSQTRFDAAQGSTPVDEAGGTNYAEGLLSSFSPTFPEEWMRYPGFHIPLGMGFVTGRQCFVTQNPPERGTSRPVPYIDNTALYIEHTRAVPEISTVAGVREPIRLPVTFYRFPGLAQGWEVIPIADVDPDLKRRLIGGPGLRPAPKMFTCSLDLASGSRGVVPAPVFERNAKWSSLAFFMEQFRLCGAPIVLADGEYLVSLELIGIEDRAWVSRDSLNIPLLTGGPMISDPVLAGKVEARDDVPIWPSAGVLIRSNRAMTPRTDGIFLPDEPIHLYFEVGGLSKDEVGATDYTVALSVSEEKSGGLVEVVAGLLHDVSGLTPQEGTVTTSWRRSGIETRNPESLQLILPEPKPQDYRLTVRVTDHVVEESAEVTTRLRIRERPPTPETAGS